eukprot:scaffold106859_cov16-Tisochrysis_lutea.AAC.1
MGRRVWAVGEKVSGYREGGRAVVEEVWVCVRRWVCKQVGGVAADRGCCNRGRAASMAVCAQVLKHTHTHTHTHTHACRHVSLALFSCALSRAFDVHVDDLAAWVGRHQEQHLQRWKAQVRVCNTIEAPRSET